MNIDWSIVLLATVTVVMVAVFICSSLYMDKGDCDELECDKCPFARRNEKR